MGGKLETWFTKPNEEKANIMDENVLTEGVTLLTEEQIFGDNQGNGQLQVMKSYGRRTGLSDLTIVLGCFSGGNSKTSDNQRAGHYLSASSDDYGNVRAVEDYGTRDSSHPYRRFYAARPVLPSSVTSKIPQSEARLKWALTDDFGNSITVVEYGEYPQTLADAETTKTLNALTEDQLKEKETGKSYTFDAEQYDAYDKPFRPNPHPEYALQGKDGKTHRYIRVDARPRYYNSILSNDRELEAGETCWIEVQPIEWLVEPDEIIEKKGGRPVPNPNAGTWIARQALFAGVQFDRKKHYDGDFEKTDMYSYLQNYFAKEMMPQRQQELVQENANAEVQTSHAPAASQTTSPLNQLIAHAYKGKPMHPDENARVTGNVIR
jgi:hypothetical protein